MKTLLLDFVLLAALGWLAVPPPAGRIHPRGGVSTTILDRHGIKLREVLSSEDGVAKWVPLREISPWLVKATVLAEDRRFYRHPGIDPGAIARSLRANLRARRIVAGGSTITQQLVRNVYHLPRRSIPAKLFEACAALRFEFHLGKPEILEAYLNRVCYANQLFGVEAAARTYFGRSCRELSIAEAAFLAGIPQSPPRYDPYRHADRTAARQQEILRRLARYHELTASQHELARREELQLIPKEQVFRAPHFTDWVIRRHPGPLPTELRTTLNDAIQVRVERALQQNVRRLRRNNVTNGAVLVLRTETGEVVAMAGSADYFDREHDGQVNACLARRQPGSTLKPFTYELALEDGVTASELLPDLELHAPEWSGDYMPRNYDETWHGPVRFRTALACSYNIPAVRLLDRVGTERFLQRLRALGFASLQHPAKHYGLGLTLGAGDVTMLELARAYLCLANGGRYQDVTPWPPGPDAHLTPVLSEPAAGIITDILADNTSRTPAFGSYSVLNLGFACAAKTGTSKDYRDNWTIGFTRDYLVAVWVGNFDGAPMQGVSGISGAGPLFREIMLALHPNPPPPFVMPEGVIECAVCPKSGALPGPDCANQITEYFVAGNEPSSLCAVHRRYRLDRRTGRGAGPDVPSEQVIEPVFEVYPPEYHAWMQLTGLPLPPPDAITATTDSTPAPTGLRIRFPNRNAVFKLDPDLDPAFQSIELAVTTPVDCPLVRWSIDDTLRATVETPFIYFWPLSPGRHRIRCEDPQGRRDEVSVFVAR